MERGLFIIMRIPRDKENKMSRELAIRPRLLKAQKGMVLFFALIALVALSLAAAALIRSVDTNVMIAGNLAFKNSATMSADSGVASAVNWMANNPALLNANSAVNGYYATSSGITLTSPAAWGAGFSRLADGNGIVSGYEATTANTISYIIQRMCNITGVADPAASNCLFGSAASGGGSTGGLDDQNLGASLNYSSSPIYRVTARVVGPKNTISYVQAYVY